MASLRTLECLVALVDTGSMTAAAAALHLSQPALSHQVSTLERELGTAVVERRPRGVRVTAAGRATAAEARIALSAAERTIRVGRQVGAGAAGELRLACVETMTAWLLVPALRAWRGDRPEVRLGLSEFTSSDRMIESMRSGGADVAVGPRPTEQLSPLWVIGQEEMVAVLPPDHRLRAHRSLSVHALSGEPFIHYVPENGLAIWVDQFAARYGLRLTPILRTRSPRTAAQLAAAGLGVTVVPASALAGTDPGAVKALRPAIRRDIVVTVAAQADALARAFADDLVRHGLPSVSRKGVAPGAVSRETSADLPTSYHGGKRP